MIPQILANRAQRCSQLRLASQVHWPSAGFGKVKGKGQGHAARFSHQLATCRRRAIAQPRQRHFCDCTPSATIAPGPTAGRVLAAPPSHPGGGDCPWNSPPKSSSSSPRCLACSLPSSLSCPKHEGAPRRAKRRRAADARSNGPSPDVCVTALPSSPA